MPNTLKTRLAASLNIKPSTILNYAPSPKGSGYTVILTNYQKHNNIHPAESIPHSELLGSEAAALPHSSTSGIPHPTSDIIIPVSLKPAFTNPHRATRITLRQLCDHLSIPYTTKTRKTQLVAKINTWKQDHES